eukprot:576165-Pelagomonas_calceolata.AAC.1
MGDMTLNEQDFQALSEQAFNQDDGSDTQMQALQALLELAQQKWEQELAVQLRLHGLGGLKRKAALHVCVASSEKDFPSFLVTLVKAGMIRRFTKITSMSLTTSSAEDAQCMACAFYLLRLTLRRTLNDTLPTVGDELFTYGHMGHVAAALNNHSHVVGGGVAACIPEQPHRALLWYRAVTIVVDRIANLLHCVADRKKLRERIRVKLHLSGLPPSISGLSPPLLHTPHLLGISALSRSFKLLLEYPKYFLFKIQAILSFLGKAPVMGREPLGLPPSGKAKKFLAALQCQLSGRGPVQKVLGIPPIGS